MGRVVVLGDALVVAGVRARRRRRRSPRTTPMPCAGCWEALPDGQRGGGPHRGRCRRALGTRPGQRRRRAHGGDAVMTTAHVTARRGRRSGRPSTRRCDRSPTHWSPRPSAGAGDAASAEACRASVLARPHRGGGRSWREARAEGSACRRASVDDDPRPRLAARRRRLVLDGTARRPTTPCAATRWPSWRGAATARGDRAALAPRRRLARRPARARTPSCTTRRRRSASWPSSATGGSTCGTAVLVERAMASLGPASPGCGHDGHARWSTVAPRARRAGQRAAGRGRRARRRSPLHEVVELGAQRLPAEVASIHRGPRHAPRPTSTPGAPAWGTRRSASGAPLSARLGPGLLGGIFDGMLRRLGTGRTWLGPGTERRGPRAAVEPRRWPYRRAVDAGARRAGARCSGRCPRPAASSTGSSCPPGVDGTVEWIASAGPRSPTTTRSPWSAARRCR